MIINVNISQNLIEKMKEEKRNNIFTTWNNKATERSSFYYNMLSLTIKLENMYLVESLKILVKSQITISTHLRKRQTFIIIKIRCAIITENLYFWCFLYVSNFYFVIKFIIVIKFVAFPYSFCTFTLICTDTIFIIIA